MSNSGGSSYPHGSYYTATAPLPNKRPPLQGSTSVDVAIVGAGYTGLTAALHLAKAGKSVAVLEAHRVGWGASGRNGGQIHSGQRQEPEWFEKRFNRAIAQQFFNLGEDAKQLVFSLIEQYKMDCELTPGLFHAAHKKRYVSDFQRHVENMNAHYGHPVSWVGKEETAQNLGTNAYWGAIYDPTAGHLHPLKFALGLAGAALGEGAKIYENTPVLDVSDWNNPVLSTSDGSVRAGKVLICGNGYLGSLVPKLDARIMPINNFVVATRPLTDAEIPLPSNACASDSRFVVNYWRMSADNRLIFGGGENYSPNFPTHIDAFVRKPLSAIYPQFRNIDIHYAWGGTLAITVHRVPFVQMLTKNAFAAAGFSGQGVTLAPLAGQVLAEAASGQTDRLHQFSNLPTPPFPGGRILRSATLALGLGWYALRDRF